VPEHILTKLLIMGADIVHVDSGIINTGNL